MLTIYNSFTKEKEPFKPLNNNTVNMYVCGVTVYDFCHLGHLRTYTAFDVVYRYLKHKGYDVNYIRNITDIDDKIIARANQNNESWDAVTQRFTQAMHEDFEATGIIPPSKEPKATESMDLIINMIQTLLDNRYAYIASNGDVYYSVSHCKPYGELSSQDLSSLRSGARVAVEEAKRDALDFVLWKLAKPHEPSWTSPWGNGRPGWHIECSAMSIHCLGETLDIHGGGHDLLFPHHENEKAQSEAATGKPFVKTWMHVGFLQIDNEKMSKSLGNFFTIRDVLKQYDPETLRFFLISSHYRSQINYSDQSLNQARSSLETLYRALIDLPETYAVTNTSYESAFEEAMDDDFNTPIALSVLFEIATDIQKQRISNIEKAAQLGALLKKLAFSLGILQQNPQVFLQRIDDTIGLTAEQIEALIEKRNKARANKDWALSDQIRDDLLEHKIVLEDSSQGTSWRRGAN